VFSLNEVRPLFRAPLAAAAFPYDVSPDGQSFLVNTFAEAGTLDFTTIVEWKELLKNK
jgi:hypothetical protein